MKNTFFAAVLLSGLALPAAAADVFFTCRDSVSVFNFGPLAMVEALKPAVIREGRSYGKDLTPQIIAKASENEAAQVFKAGAADCLVSLKPDRVVASFETRMWHYEIAN